MTITQDFIHKFQGFSNRQLSRCHIRILEEPNKPIVIICSQLANNPGTSVTNAVEIIAQSIQEYLVEGNLTLATSIQQYFQTSKLTKILGDLITRLKESKNSTVFSLESLKLALEKHEQYLNRSEKISQILWIEYYDKSINSDYHGYREVTFESNSWTPNWDLITIEALSEKTGYPIEEFIIPYNIIHQK